MSGATDGTGTAAGRRMAIVGGGMGGVSVAYLCGPAWTVDLFEARPVLGGNASTVVVHDDDQEVAVDIGAESFNPETHPWYWALLQEIGALDPAGGADDIRIPTPPTVSIFDARTRAPLFVSKQAHRTPRYAVSFLRFTRAARALALSSPSYELTLGEWVDGLRIDARFSREVLLPWLASLTCCSVEMVRTQSAYPFLLQFARVFPRSVIRTPRAYGSRIGLGGVLAMLVARCERLTVRTDTAVTRVERDDDAWFVRTVDGRHGPYEHVVVNAPPHASRAILGAFPSGLLDVLDRLTYYPTRMIVHRDPIYMPKDEADWCSHNAAVLGDACEATVWTGSSRTNARTGRPVRIFKSWATNRHVAAGDVLAEQTFLHPSLTPETFRAARELARWQGTDGLHFSGHATMLTDLQETALYSGMSVVRRIDPASPRLRALEQRVGATGRADLGYALDEIR